MPIRLDEPPPPEIEKFGAETNAARQPTFWVERPFRWGPRLLPTLHCQGNSGRMPERHFDRFTKASSTVSDLTLQPILVLLSRSAAGNPSQYMVEKTFQRHQLDWRYLSVEVAEEALRDAVQGIRAMGFAGGNCGRPHNRLIGSFLDRLETTAQRVGTVNLIRREGAELVGENTEGKGLVQALQTLRQSHTRRVLLFGSGDFGRAAALELAEAGAEEIIVVSRAPEHADALVQLLNIHFKLAARGLPWDDILELPDEIDLVVNATPVGTEAVQGMLPFDWQSLAPEAVVVDANLEETVPTLLQEAAERELATVNGLDIFLEQAAINFRLWTGTEPERTVMREAVEEYLEL